ncbi:hypothetical protein ACFQY0_04580 [Haloferula chungangensis]|uniref:DUF4124 domain-containing protein n=1 Tax=Haloferula chungangensis TaxID=1048331 RepID=A0ABW2L3Z1_9BACT
MKVLWMLVFALPLMAEEVDETTWYDSEGKVVLVEGPDAVPTEQPFVAEWRKREIERRDRMNYRNTDPFYDGIGDWGSRSWGWTTGTYVRGRYGCFSPRFYSGFHRPYRASFRAGSRVIIRW